jgi:hypothetical protein
MTATAALLAGYFTSSPPCVATSLQQISSPTFAPTKIFLTNRPPNNGSTSPQLDSYRALGYWMTERIVAAAKSNGSIDTFKEFFESLEKLDFTTMKGLRAFLF